MSKQNADITEFSGFLAEKSGAFSFFFKASKVDTNYSKTFQHPTIFQH